jgi:hypothetical protein
MSDHLDQILEDLRTAFVEADDFDHGNELALRVIWGGQVYKDEVIMRMSLKAPGGGKEFIERLRKIQDARTPQQRQHYPST